MRFRNRNFFTSHQTTTSPSTWYRQGVLWVALLLGSVACLYLARLVCKYQTYPFDGDEVNHALPSLLMARALSQHAWADFLHLFYAQSFYPPAITVVKALSFVLFDPSFLHARLFSLVCFFLAILITCALCLEIDSQQGGIAGLVAVMLMLSSSTLLIHATLSMVEIPGLFVSLLFLSVYVRALQKDTARRLRMVSLVMILVFLTKYTFGIVVVLTLGLTEVTLLPSFKTHQLWPTIRSNFTSRWLYLFGPFLFAAVLWFWQPEKIAGFVGFTQPLSSNEPWLSLQNAGGYLRSLAIHNLPSPLFVIVAASGLVWALWQWAQRPLRPLVFYFVTGMGMMMAVNHPLNTRFIVTFVPALYILTGLMVAFLWRQRQLPGKRTLITALLGLIGLFMVLSVPTTWRRWTQLDSLLAVMIETDPVIDEMAVWIQQQVPSGQTVFLVNYWDQLTPNLFSWYQGLRDPADLARPSPYLIVTPATDETVAATRQNILDSQADYLVLFEGGPWGAPFWPEYTTALGDVLVPTARKEFTVPSFEAVQSWLATASETEPTWTEVRENEAYTLSMGVVIYRLQPPASFSP